MDYLTRYVVLRSLDRMNTDAWSIKARLAALQARRRKARAAPKAAQQASKSKYTGWGTLAQKPAGAAVGAGAATKAAPKQAAPKKKAPAAPREKAPARAPARKSHGGGGRGDIAKAAMEALSKVGET